MKSFICKIKKLNSEIIGFDMDGTLYDEFDFVSQAYYNVSIVMSKLINVNEKQLYKNLCNEWLQLDSSGNIFQNVAQKYTNYFPEQYARECVCAFRESSFELVLPRRTKYILNYLKDEGYPLFLVTDGNGELQRRKIDSLELMKWFSNGNIVVSGECGRHCQKPLPFMASKIGVLSSAHGKVVYVGDREVDRDFARSCGFEFIRVSNMRIVEQNV